MPRAGAPRFTLGEPSNGVRSFPIFAPPDGMIMPEDHATFCRDFIDEETRPTISYPVEGLHNTWVVVPAAQDAARPIDPSDRWRLAPEDIPPLLAELPDPSLINVVLLLDERNPWDAWLERHHGRPFVTAATSAKWGLVTFFRGARGDEARTVLMHEWAHQLHWSLPSALGNRAKAAFLAEADGFHLRALARANDDENFATHLGEAMLGEAAADFLRLVEAAPVRAMMLADALEHALSSTRSNPATAVRSACERRIAHVRVHARARAAAALVVAVNGVAEPVAHSLLASLLAHYGTGEDLASIARPVNLQLGHDSDVDTALIERVSRTPQIDTLNIAGARCVDPHALALLARTGIKRLCLQEGLFGDAAAEPIARLTGLRHLIAGKTGFSDRALPHLATMRGLEELVLRGTRFSAAGKAALRQALPDTRIEF